LSTTWWIEPIEAPSGVRYLTSKEQVLKQRLLPEGLTKLSRSVSKIEVGAELPAGTELIEVAGGPGPIFCEGVLQQGKLTGRAQVCFMDSDGDQRFDTTFQSRSQTPALVMINGRMPKKSLQLATPISYQTVDPATATLGTFVAIERRNFFNIYGRESFTILFGSSDQQERLTDPVQFKSSDLPKQMNILGSSFTALSEKDGRMAIKVEAAMPRSPFGVYQSITYR
jgi:hypothetical protein